MAEVKRIGGTIRREFLASGLSFAMLAPWARRAAAEGPVITLAPGPEVNEFKKAQDRLLAKYQVTARSLFAKLPNLLSPPMSWREAVVTRSFWSMAGNAMAVQYAPLLSELQREFCWYAPDRPGCGLTDKFDYSPATSFKEQATEFVGSVMDALGLRRASLIGSSMGG